MTPGFFYLFLKFSLRRATDEDRIMSSYKFKELGPREPVTWALASYNKTQTSWVYMMP